MQALFACVTQQHNLVLVGLAALICSLGAGAGFALGGQVFGSKDFKTRAIWGTAGVAATASAIWATHFIAMLAFEPGLPFRFDIGRTILSYVVALMLVGAGACVSMTASGRVGRFAGGAVLGGAILAMHYTGMSAYEVQGHLRWDAATILASVLCGCLVSGLAVLLSFQSSRLLRICAPALFVLAVCLAHFVGMSAVTVVFDPSVAEPRGGVDQNFLVAVVGSISFLIIVLSLTSVWVAVRARRQLAAEEQHLHDLADIAVEGLLICRGEMIVGVNRSLERMIGSQGQGLIGCSIGDILPGIDRTLTGEELDGHLACVSSVRIPVRVIGKEIEVGGIAHVVLAVRDQRERLRSEAKMMALAHHDTLTGLANRLSFGEALASRLLLPRKTDQAFALLMLDLDRFKTVNDTLGHGTGDALLKRVAARLKRAVRPGDLVARLGGDEFAIIAGVDGDMAVVRRIADDVIDLIERPFLIDGQILEVGTSIGIALAPSDGDEAEPLSRNADLALYSAKKAGGTYRFFEVEMNARVQARRSLEVDLRRAEARQEFEVYYQPQIDPRTGAFEGAEALVRWNHPQRGMVSPAEFIPLAEEIGLIGSIGDWVLRTACAEAATWSDHLSVAVNLSPLQFRDARLAASIAAILAETGLQGRRLELEITENALLQDDGHTLSTLHALRALGIRISMDDFGTGYSSLSYLRRFPFDKIKIDQSFIRQIPGDPDSIAIVQAIASLGVKLGMTITAEGVETAEQRAFTVSEGCDQIQGYLISKPVPASRVAELFAAAAIVRNVA